jgi:ferritin
MGNHQSSDQMKNDLEIMLSKINALEIIAGDEFQKGTVKVLRALVNNQIHSVSEFDHLKKALDLLTLEIFEIKTKVNSL